MFQIVKKQRLPKKKEVESIFSWEEAMRSAPKTQGICSLSLKIRILIFVVVLRDLIIVI